MTRLDKQQIETLKKDIASKRVRVQCASVDTYRDALEVVVSKLYYNIFTDTYYETVSRCYVSLGEVSTLTFVVDREAAEKDWLCDRAYPTRVRYMREHIDLMVGQLQDSLEHAGNDKVRTFLEEAIRIVKFMDKDTRF